MPTRTTYFLTLLLWLITLTPAQAAQLRVAVAQKISEVKIGTSTTAIISDQNGKKIGELQPQQGLTAQSINGGIKIGETQVTQVSVKPQKGGYILSESTGGAPQAILIATGTEVPLVRGRIFIQVVPTGTDVSYAASG